MRTRLPSAHEVGTRARQAGTALLEQLGIQPNVDPAGRRGLQPIAPVQGRPMDPVQLAARWPVHTEHVIALAERVEHGIFDLLGYQDLPLGNPPDWHLDTMSGQRGTLDHWRRIPYNDAATVGDRKRIWEVNRHDHLVLLAQAHRLTGDPRYAIILAAHLDDWLQRNPAKRGINWVSSLELGFRIINWIWALHWAGQAIPDPLKARVVASLEEQAVHIERYLSHYYSPNTHLTGEALGLLYAGVALPSLPHAARWRATGLDLLHRELERQFHADGVYFEQTSWYQRYCCDFYLHATLLARSAGLPLAPNWLPRINLMVDALVYATHPDGTLPLLGDDDGGVLLPLSRTPSGRTSDTLALAAVTLERHDCAALLGPPPPLVGWVAGTTGLEQWGAGREALVLPPSRAFRDGGWYSMRSDWSTNALHLLCDAGPHGGLTAAHAHADALSFVLATNGRQVLTDPGTYTYVGRERDEFRGTAMHGTVVVAGKGSAEPAGPFRWRRTPRTTVHDWLSCPAADFLDAEHDGFRRLPRDATHARAILWRKGAYILVLDRVWSRAASPWAAHFPASCGLHFSVASRAAAICDDAGQHLSLHWASGDMVRVEPTWVSPAYGVRVPSERLVNSPPEGSDALLTVLDPVSASTPVLRVQRLKAVGGMAWSIDSEAWSDVVAVARDGTVEVESFRSTGRVFWCRRSRATGQVEEYLLSGGGHATGEGIGDVRAASAHWFQSTAISG